MEINLKRFLEAPGRQIAWYIAGGAATVLMAVVILCNLLLIVSNIREPNQMPSVFGVRPAIVLSGSMSPAFEAGDVILLKKTGEPDGLEVGDVACYLYSGKATTHRIIERFEAEGKPRYIMKGDYNNVEDRLAVDPEQIQGVWTGGRIRHLGKFLMFLQSTMGMFLFLICPLAGLLGWDILKRRRADRIRREGYTGEEAAGYGYEKDGRVSGLEGIAALRGILGHRAEPPVGYSEYSGEDRTRPVRARREESYEESASCGYRASESRSPQLQEEEIPRPSRRRPTVRERERPAEAQRSHESRDDEFYYYSQLDDELDYCQELEEAAEHYRKMKEALTRYRRMEAVMNRCRRLEEELSRYEALAEKLGEYERQGRREKQSRSTGQTATGVSNQGMRRESPVDHIERPGGTTPPTVE